MKSISIKYRIFLYILIGLGSLIGYYALTIASIIITGDRYEGMTISAMITPVLISLTAAFVFSQMIFQNYKFGLPVALILTGITIGLMLILSTKDIFISESDYGIKGLILIITLSNIFTLEGFYQTQKLIRKYR